MTSTGTLAMDGREICKLDFKTEVILSTQELQSYRLSSLEDPTDEMLHAIMEQVAESARQSGTKVREEIYRRLEQIKSKN